MKKATLSNAIEALIPNEIFIISVIDGKEVVEYKNPDKAPTEEAIQAKLSELQAEYDTKSYARARQSEYPSWQEQMDMQYWDAKNGTNTWQEAIEAVKTKYPKGE